MCGVCGCGDSRIEDSPERNNSPEQSGDRSHGHSHVHDHSHGPATVIVHHHHYYYPQGQNDSVAVDSHGSGHHQHSSNHSSNKEFNQKGGEQGLRYYPEENQEGGQGEDRGESGISQRRLMKIERDVLDKNNHLARHNREHFREGGQLVLNLVSSPGSGKTTLLVETLKTLKGKRSCAVIEGDQQTTNDADRIRATGTQALQINTGKGCHLDARMVHDACHKLALENDSLLFIENVGNLVCPSSFDLGEKYKVAILSVTEGEDKPLKYPNMFAASQLMIINKIDLLPYVAFDVEQCIENARKVNPYIQVIQLSATTGEGIQAWLSWLEQA